MDGTRGGTESEAWLELIARYAVHGMEEWSASSVGWLPRLADGCDERDPGGELGRILAATRVEQSRTDALGPPTPRLLIDDPELHGNPPALLERAARHVAPGGLLLIRLAAGADSPQRARALAAAIEATTGLRPRTIHEVDDAALLVARRAPERPRVALLPDSPGACLQIRTLGPLEELESRGAVELCLLPIDADPRVLVDQDLLLLQRFGGLPAARLLLAARELGLAVAVELDDDFFNLPWYNPGAKIYGSFEVQTALRAILRGSDAVVTSTPYLGQRMSRFNANVHTMHNIVDTQLFVRRPSPFDEPGMTTFGYIGTKTHEEDFRPVVGPLRELILRERGRVRAVFVGHVPEGLDRLPHVRYLGWFSTYQNAAAALSRSGANVALAPLMDVEFNRSKSAMKYLEYGACGIPGIFSDVEAYASFVRHGENGLLVPRHTEEAWTGAMERIVGNPAERERMADNAWRDATENHSIEQRADDFLQLYNGIIENAGGVEGRPVDEANAATATPATLTVALRLDAEPGFSLPVLARLIGEFPEDAQIIVISRHSELARLLQLSGSVEIVDVSADGGSGNGMGRALELARGSRLLHLDGRCLVEGDLLARLSALATPDVGAVGPRNLWPSTEQSAHLVSDSPNGATLRERLAAYAADHPATAARWLDQRCVLLNREAALGVGGIDERLTWEDGLFDLCLRLDAGGFKLLVANGTSVELRSRSDERVAPVVRAESRRRLADRVAPIDTAGLIDPARTYGLDGERLEVWLWARAASPYLSECLSRLERHGDLPFDLHILHDEGDVVVVGFASRHGATPHAWLPGSAPSPLHRALALTQASHLLFLHDGVMPAPGCLRDMLNAMLRGNVPAVVPFSNDGSPGQRMVIDRGLSLDRLDEVMGERMSERQEPARAIGVCSGFCVLLEVEHFRATLDGWLSASGGKQALLATRGYAHVLGHPEAASATGCGAWPGGPFDTALPSIDELAALDPAALADPRAFVGRIRPLLEALKQNPLDARTLAAIGLLYLVKGELSEGMSFLDRARRLDPFAPEVRIARQRARQRLDGIGAEPPAAVGA